jgi:uncharacterized protein DUF6582
MATRFKGLIAPVEVPTGDGRMFAAGKLSHRQTPFPLLARFSSGGHDGATVVGKVNRIFQGPGGYWCEGEFLDPTEVPEVKKAIYMLQNKVMGPSVDLDRDFTVEVIKHPTRPDKKAGMFKEYNVIGITLVPMPAFPQVHLSVDTDEDKALLASVGIDASGWKMFDVNAESWRAWPLAPRNYPYDADDAVKRIAYWAGIGSRQPNLNNYASAFLWRDGNQVADTLAQNSFRLPLADIINGQPYLVYHAVYAAAALLSGAHGGLPNIPNSDKQAMIPVINEIYAAFRQQFNDQNLLSPFEGGGRQPSQEMASTTENCGCDNMPDVTINISDGVLAIPATGIQPNGDHEMAVKANKATPKSPYGPVKYADPGFQEDGVKRYPLDSEEHCRAAWAYINMAKNAAQYTPEQLKQIKARIQKALKGYGVETAQAQSNEMAIDLDELEDDDPASLLASVAPLAPPSAWFENPGLRTPTPLTIKDDGHVYGHLAQWKVCHVGIGQNCVMAPKSRTQYSLFRQGTVVCDDGSEAPIGKITLGTGHADAHWGIVPSREHYDNTGWAAAVVNVGEDGHGIWVNGALTTTMTPERVAELRAASLSGDWRMVNGNLELIAALAVNSPGFPIYREKAGQAFSLAAVGIVGFSEEDEDVTEDSDESEEYPTDDVMDDASELSSRMERLREIEEDYQLYGQDRRAAQLAALDASMPEYAEEEVSA